MKRPQKIADGVYRLLVVTTNVYFFGKPGGPWGLVDTGIPGSELRIIPAAEKLYGTPPEAIFLTHGHGDHAGAALRLAEHWNAPIYAHRLERPYLTGKAEYPPMDPTLGGVAGFASRFVPMSVVNLGPHLVDLPEGGEMPFLADWRWIEAPGHSPGMVAYFRESDRVLIAGDALTTMNLNSIGGNMFKTRGIHGPAEASTIDWYATETTVQRLADLKPDVLACAHGKPFLAGEGAARRLADFAFSFMAPNHGRYVSDPAETDETGVTFLPPPAGDPLRPVVAGAAVVTVGLLAWLFARMSTSRKANNNP